MPVPNRSEWSAVSAPPSIFRPSANPGGAIRATRVPRDEPRRMRARRPRSQGRTAPLTGLNSVQ